MIKDHKGKIEIEVPEQYTDSLNNFIQYIENEVGPKIISITKPTIENILIDKIDYIKNPNNSEEELSTRFSTMISARTQIISLKGENFDLGDVKVKFAFLNKEKLEYQLGYEFDLGYCWKYDKNFDINLKNKLIYKLLSNGFSQNKGDRNRYYKMLTDTYFLTLEEEKTETWDSLNVVDKLFEKEYENRNYTKEEYKKITDEIEEEAKKYTASEVINKIKYIVESKGNYWINKKWSANQINWSIKGTLSLGNGAKTIYVENLLIELSPYAYVTEINPNSIECNIQIGCLIHFENTTNKNLYKNLPESFKYDKNFTSTYKYIVYNEKLFENYGTEEQKESIDRKENMTKEEKLLYAIFGEKAFEKKAKTSEKNQILKEEDEETSTWDSKKLNVGDSIEFKDGRTGIVEDYDTKYYYVRDNNGNEVKIEKNELKKYEVIYSNYSDNKCSYFVDAHSEEEAMKKAEKELRRQDKRNFVVEAIELY